MTDTRYPRDLRGYGRNPPHPQWPGNARVAVQFVVNFEEGGENNILHGDRASEAFLSDVLGAQPWPGQRHVNMESIFEYGSRAGFWRLWRMFTERKWPTTVFGVATALERNPEVVAAMKEAGWEIASHGLKWIDHKDMPEARSAPRSPRRSASTPRRPARGRSAGTPGAPRSTRNRLLMEEGGFLYLCDSYADDLPYWVKGASGPQLIIPYTLDANDMRFVNPQGFADGEQFFTYLKDSVRRALCRGRDRAEDDVGRPALPSRRPARPRRGADALPRLYRQARARLGADAACRSRSTGTTSMRILPPTRSRSDREAMSQIALSDLNAASYDDFVAALDNVVEYSPWIAEQARRARPFAGINHCSTRSRRRSTSAEPKCGWR